MQLWTLEHAYTLPPALAVMLLLTALLRKLLSNKPHKVRLIPLQIIAGLLLALEVGKQAVSLWRGYDLYHLPFHFCSLFIFAMPALAFYRGKHRQKVYGVVAALLAALAALMLIYPNLIYSAGNIQSYFTDYMSFHTVTFHNLVMLAFFLVLALQIQETVERGEVRRVVLFIIGFCTVSATMAQLLKTNYANYYSCNIPVFEAVRAALQPAIGYVLTQLIYILIVSLLNIIFVYGAYWLYRVLRHALQPKQSVC